MARIVIHHARARRESDQDTFRYVRRILHEIRFQARIHLLHGPYTTGRLAKSLHIKGPFIQPGRLVEGSVGSDLAYASAVETGAERHPIYPRPPKTRLKFYWRKVGRIVTPGLVRHPGMRGKRYLARAAEEAGRRHNLLVIIYDV